MYRRCNDVVTKHMYVCNISQLRHIFADGEREREGKVAGTKHGSRPQPRRAAPMCVRACRPTADQGPRQKKEVLRAHSNGNDDSDDNNVVRGFSYAHTCIHAYTHAYTDTHTHTQTDTHTHRDTQIYARTHTHIRTYAHTHICTYTHTHIRTYTDIHRHKQTHANMHRHTHAHTRTRTYGHTDIQ